MNQSQTIDVSGAIAAVAVAGILAATATIQQFDGAQDELGLPLKADDSHWTAVLSELPAQITPDNFMARISTDAELHAADYIALRNQRHLLIGSYEPTIDQTMRAVVTEAAVSTTYEILAVEHDSQRTMTRLLLQYHRP